MNPQENNLLYRSPLTVEEQALFQQLEAVDLHDAEKKLRDLLSSSDPSDHLIKETVNGLLRKLKFVEIKMESMIMNDFQ